MFAPEIQAKIAAELANAEIARAAGNEGQARVCARRAAGAAIRAYFEKMKTPIPSPSAIDLLQAFRRDPTASAQAIQVVDHLLERVTPEFQLSPGIDLLAEARWLVIELENQA